MNRYFVSTSVIALAALLAAVAPQSARAQDSSPPITGLDSKKPVEINADALEVRQQENIAIFTGNVIAVQGVTRLKSDKMIVHYRGKNTNMPSDPTQSTVELIEVDGNVLLSTPEETASGERGVYEVARKQVKLLNDVVLTRGKNVLKGDSLVYDFNTGKSVINSPYHTPAEAQKGSGGRVKALFMPGKDKN